jgi:glycopeptide antibiotics resistance protein
MDKLIHLILYLTFIILWGLSLFKSRFSLKLLLSISILFGLFLEFLQHILPFGRCFDWGDFIANSTGAIIGAIILLFLKKKLL